MNKWLCFLTLSLLSLSVRAEYAQANPNKPISRSEIIAKVEQQYEKSTILSVQARPTNAAPDCHIVRVLKSDGEMTQLEIAC